MVILAMRGVEMMTPKVYSFKDLKAAENNTNTVMTRELALETYSYRVPSRWSSPMAVPINLSRKISMANKVATRGKTGEKHLCF